METDSIRQNHEDYVYVTNFGSLYHGSTWLLKVLKEEQQRILSREASRSEEDKRNVFYNDSHKLTTLSTSIEVMCCMSIESFLNHYGMFRLGAEFYKRNIERLGPVQKLETILALSQGKLLRADSKICKLVRKLFDRRNQLVHPKSAEYLVHNFNLKPNQNYDPVATAQHAITNADNFFSQISKLDNKAETIISTHLSEFNSFDTILKQQSIFDFLSDEELDSSELAG